MATTTHKWKTLPHGPIEKLTENLWRVEGSLPSVSMKRHMTVSRLSDGRLVIHSAVALDESSMKELEAFGTPSFLVVPNAFHRFDAPRFKERYPSITVLAPKGSRAKVAERVAVNGAYEDFPQDDAVRLETIAGVKKAEGAMVVRSQDGVTLVLNDVVFNMASKPKDAIGWMVTSLFGSAPGPRVSRLFKMLAVSDKKALRADLERMAATPGLKRVIVAHGAVAHGADASGILLAAANGL